MTEKLTNGQARRIALAAQGFTVARPSAVPDARHLRRVLSRTQLLQMDSIYVLERAHYLPAYSRLGAYRHEIVDRAAYRPERTLFEYWGHAASLVPVELFPLLRWRMRAAEQKWIDRRIDDRHPGLTEKVYHRLQTEGAMTAREFDDGQVRRRDHWGWNWSAAKEVLEWLFSRGLVSVADRRGFERVYDLTERVIPKRWWDAPEVECDEAHRQLMARAAVSLGVATEHDLRDYFRLAPGPARKALTDLVADGTVTPVAVEGWDRKAYLHKDAVVPRRFPARTLVSPFDPLVWRRERVERLWDFFYRIEIYVPKEKRVHGYYVLPFLWGEHLAARVDLKADRSAKVLRVLSAWREERFSGSFDPIAHDLAAELVTVADWLGLSGVEPPRHGDAAAAVASALRGME